MFAHTLIGIFALLPFLPRLELFNGAISTKSLALLITCSALLLYGSYLLWKGKNKSVEVGYLHIGTIVVLGSLMLSTGLSTDPAHSFFGDALRSVGSLLLCILAVTSILAAEFFKERDWSVLRRTVLISAAVFSLLTVFGSLGLKTFLWIDLTNPGASLGNDTFAGLYLVLAVLFGSTEFIGEKKLAWKRTLAACIGFIAISPIFFSWQIVGGGDLLGSARASSVALIAFFGVVTTYYLATKYLSVGKRQAAVTLVSVFGALVILGSFLLITPGSVVQNGLRDDTTSARFITWNLSIQAVQERPVFGWGVEEFDRAFETHFDPALYKKTGLVEVWFDKAHNVILDTLVTLGSVGLVSFTFLIGAYLWILTRLQRRGRVGGGEMLILGAFPFVHILQTQTSFDVAPTYAFLMIIGSYVMWIERESLARFKLDVRALILIVVILGTIGLGHGISEFSRQQSLVMSLGATNLEERHMMVDAALSRRADFEGLHKSANLFVESVYARGENSDSLVYIQANNYLLRYLESYDRYLAEEPDHYRARVNYAYLLLVYEAWGGEGAAKAQVIIRDSYQYSPHNPLTYVLHAMSLVMLNDLNAADQKLTEAETMFGPGVKILEDTRGWLSRQKEGDAKHTLLRIGNI